MTKLVFNNSQLIGYTCEFCNGYNDILNFTHCIYCKIHSGFTAEEINLSYYIRVKRTGEFYPMSSDNKFMEFFIKARNDEAHYIKNLDAAEKRERRIQLQQIAYEAKAKLTAHDEDEKNQTLEQLKKNKDWLLSSQYNDPSVTDAIEAVKNRKKGMSKADKQLLILKNLGVENADAIMAQVSRNMTGRAVTTPITSAIPAKERYKSQTTSAYCLNNQHKGCTGSFRLGGESESKTCDCKCHTSKPVDFGKLSFLNKK